MGFAETFKALSDPVRRDILTLLKEGSMSAGDIAAQFDMTAATISYHLKILKKSGLVCETKERVKMTKKNKKIILITSMITILPILAGLIL